MTLLSIYLVITMMATGQESLPSSITYEQKGDRCIYTISGVSIMEGLSERYVNQQLERAYSNYPGGLELFLDEEKGTIKIIGSDELFDLPSFVGWLSINLGALPYWDELIIRDLKSSEYDPDIYEIVFQDTITSTVTPGHSFYELRNIAKGDYILSMFMNSWNAEPYYLCEFMLHYDSGAYSLSKTYSEVPIEKEKLVQTTIGNNYDCSDSLLVKYAAGRTGYLHFNRWMNHCICGDKYAMRLFTCKGRYIWADVDNIQLAFWPSIADMTGDGIEEIIIVGQNHGKTTVSIYQNGSTIAN